MELSQGKYSSHVIEVAISHADERSLEAMFLEVFGGYDTDKFGFLLFLNRSDMGN